MRNSKTDKPPSEEYQNFEKLAKQLIAVPKSEIERHEAEYQRPFLMRSFNDVVAAGHDTAALEDARYFFTSNTSVTLSLMQMLF